MLQKKVKFLFYALILIIVCACFLISPKYGCAQDGVQVWGEGDIAKTAIEEQTGMRAQDPRVTAVNIIRITLGFLGIIAVIIIIYAGYLWMTAGGSAEQIEKAKMLMRNAVIGLVIILSSFAIVSFILSKLINATGGEGGWDIAGRGNFPPGGGIYGCADPATSCGDATCVEEISSVPYVCAISPQTGPKGAYVTIKGYHFGEFKERISKVLFGEYEAEIVACPGDNNNPSWRDNSIVAIVPSIDMGNYSVEVINGNSKENSVANQKTFKVTDGVVPPGIACIIPDEGKENEKVEIYGDYFGDEQVSSKVLFNKEKETVVNKWAMKQISVIVPSGSLSGDVFAYVNGLNSNGYPFKVLCDKHEDCSSGCCYNSSYCLDLAECVGASCDSDKEAPLCQVGEGCALSLICRDDNCACRLPGENEPCSISKDSCVQGICADNLTCGADCKCHDLPGIGEKCLGGCGGGGSCESGLVCGEDCVCREKEAGDPCDADLNAIGCQIGDCGNNLICDIFSCSCKELPNKGESCDSNEALGCQIGDCYGNLSCDSADCLCKALPIIDWIEPSDGAPGNLVTIGGVNFGNDKGKVQFVIGETIVDARLAGEVNRDCELGEWNDTKIIVEVPKKGLEGREGIEVKIRVTPENSEFSDEKNFLVNDIVRPGLCAAYKIESGEKISSGEPLEDLYLAGVNLKNIDTKEEITFGSDVAGENPPYDPKANSTVITKVTIPNLLPDVTNIFVEEAISKEKSNPVVFTILESSLTPMIDGFEPKAAHPGDYVRIYGQGFGSVAREVKFGSIHGSFSFPYECFTGGGYWNDSQIIVKVPTAADGEYKIKVVVNEIGQEIKSRDKIYIGDYCSHDYGACRESEEGEGCSGRGECVKSVSPGLCKIMPTMGPALTPVNFYGENFGQAEGYARFMVKKEGGDGAEGKDVEVLEWENRTDKTNGTNQTYQADFAKANVPIVDTAGNSITPITGPIKIKSAAGLESNGMLFEVGSCEADAQCNISGDNTFFVCCGDNTEYKGACMENQNACGFVLSPPTDYIWSFSTESPKVSVLCSKLKDETSCVSASDSINCCWEDFNNTTICKAEGTCYKEIPRVVEHCGYNQSDLACKDNTGGPSPSPWAGDPRYETIVGHPGGDQACINSKIRAEFNVAMQISTFDNSTVEIKRCNTCPAGENDCLFKNQCAGSITESVISGDNKNFEFKYDGILSANGWYKVKLASGGIKSQDGIMLDGNRDGIEGGDYEWIFKTREGNGLCDAGCAAVTPEEYTAQDTESIIRYNGEVTAKGNACIFLNSSYSWNWSLSDTDKAQFYQYINGCCDTEKEDCSKTSWKCVEPKKETSDNTPVKVTGEVSFDGKKDSDYGDLYIDFSDFSVESFWPKCQESCLNAAVGARFSGEIDAATIAGNVILEEGEEKLEIGPSNTAAGKNWKLKGSDSKEILCENFSLKVNSKYRAIIKGGADGVRSKIGGGLDGLNYDSDGDKVNDSFSWPFKTSDKECAVDRVEVEPADVYTDHIGASTIFHATPYSIHDSCSKTGERLNNNFSWTWNKDKKNSTDPSENLDIISLSTEGELGGSYQKATVVNGPLPPKTEATIKIIATEVTSKKSDFGEFTIICGFQKDEQCPMGMNMGVGTNGCCYSRPSVVYPVADITNFCPNGAIVVTFDQVMDEDGLEKAGILEKKTDGACPAVLGERIKNYELRIKNGEGEIGNWKLPFGLELMVESEIEKFASVVQEFLFDIFIGNGLIGGIWESDSLGSLTPITSKIKHILAGLMNFAKADVENWCKVGQKIEVRFDSNGNTIATIMPTVLLESGAEYRLNFDELKNIYGVATASIADADKIKVSARSEICMVDHVDVLIDYTFSNATTTDDIFICAERNDCGYSTETTLDDDYDLNKPGNQHLYIANALDQDENLLTAYFVWLEHDSYNTSQSVGAIKIEGNDISQKYVTASHLDEAKASVEIGAYDDYGYNSAATSTVAITLDMCNNPWPPILAFPYNNDEYNYGTHFCRDAGDINSVDDDLPGLKTTGQAGGQEDGIIDEELWVEN